MDAWFSLSPKFVDGEFIVERLKNRACKLSDLSARFVYDVLSSRNRTQHHCVEKYRGWGVSDDWSTVWHNLLLWRFIRMVSGPCYPSDCRPFALFRNEREPTQCLCGNKETLFHLFTACPFAMQLIEWYHDVHKRVSPTSSQPTPGKILLGYNRSVQIPLVFPCLLGIIRHYIWLAWNSFRLERVPPDFASSLAKVKSTLRFHLKIQLRHSRPQLYSDQWLVGGVFGTIRANDRIQFADILK